MTAQTRLFARLYFIEARNKTGQQFNVLVVYRINIFSAKVTKHSNEFSIFNDQFSMTVSFDN